MTSHGVTSASTNICDVIKSFPSDKHRVCRQTCCSFGLIWASGQVTVTRHCALPHVSGPLLGTVMLSTQSQNQLAFGARTILKLQADRMKRSACQRVSTVSNIKHTVRHSVYSKVNSRDSSVGTATRYGVVGPRIESRLGRDNPLRSRLTPEGPPSLLYSRITSTKSP